ncbi:MAG: sugar phosphate isomerase/epimerase [Planctomycetota bacterium]
MRLSFCTIAFRDEPIETVIPRLAEIGYPAVEVFYPQVENHSERQLIELRKLADDVGIDIAVLSPYFWLTQDETLRRRSLGIAERCVAAARLLGCPRIRTFTDTGPTGIGSGAAAPAHWDTAVAALQTITAMGRDLRFVVETHARTLADTPASTLRLLRRVDAPNLKVLFQPMFDRDYGADYEALAEHVEHIHLNNMATAEGPGWVESGPIDLVAFVVRVIGGGYRHGVSVEYCWRDVPWARAESAYALLTAGRGVCAER